MTDEIARLTAKLAASEALLEGMTTEAKRRAEHAVRLEDALLRAHAHHMFGDRPGCDDRMAALGYLRSHGLPEATPDDLDAACEGLETPWGSGPRCNSCAWVREKMATEAITHTNTCEDCGSNTDDCERCGGTGMVTKTSTGERPGF